MLVSEQFDKKSKTHSKTTIKLLIPQNFFVPLRLELERAFVWHKY